MKEEIQYRPGDRVYIVANNVSVKEFEIIKGVVINPFGQSVQLTKDVLKMLFDYMNKQAEPSEGGK